VVARKSLGTITVEEQNGWVGPNFDDDDDDDFTLFSKLYNFNEPVTVAARSKT
jgi:hypothetical protein